MAAPVPRTAWARARRATACCPPIPGSSPSPTTCRPCAPTSPRGGSSGSAPPPWRARAASSVRTVHVPGSAERPGSGDLFLKFSLEVQITHDIRRTRGHELCQGPSHGPAGRGRLRGHGRPGGLAERTRVPYGSRL
ncbi:IucA/IucC family protein [Streptomyces sp. NPDC097704]|uniref:IucA/IucC family protein n=1 Tax=Streptomyces sp. NPDC097704 TaxID=3157101 RepID=UPI00332118F1